MGKALFLRRQCYEDKKEDYFSNFNDMFGIIYYNKVTTRMPSFSKKKVI